MTVEITTTPEETTPITETTVESEEKSNPLEDMLRYDPFADVVKEEEKEDSTAPEPASKVETLAEEIPSGSEEVTKEEVVVETKASVDSSSELVSRLAVLETQNAQLQKSLQVVLQGKQQNEPSLI